jgi:phenylacetate-coenzyme A ligase PaaK-like adenylate-forming protein
MRAMLAKTSSRSNINRLAYRISQQGVRPQDLVSLRSLHVAAEKVDKELRNYVAVDWLLVAPHVCQAFDWFARPKLVQSAWRNQQWGCNAQAR